MNQILTKPVWEPFAHIEGLYNLPLPALLAADKVLGHITASNMLSPPTPSDYAMWSDASASDTPVAWLENLQKVFTLIAPGETPKISEAMLLQGAPSEPVLTAPVASSAAAAWDPCQFKANARARKLSVHPWALPDQWQKILQRAGQGLPGKQAQPPAPEILKRMCQKLCQLTLSAQKAGFEVNMSTEVVHHYLTELEDRLRLRPQGVRWATMRATVEELHRFARYSGFSLEETSYLSKRLSRYSFYEKGQDALKFQALLTSGNTTLSILDKADDLLQRAAVECNDKRRQYLRNAGAILGLYSIVPLRNADAKLILGKTLIWESGTWVIDTDINKTLQHNAEHLVVALEPEFARYVDVVVQGDHDARHLPELRARAVKRGGPLFVSHWEGPTSPTYIPRLFKLFAGTSFTTTRTMLHTDQAIHRGEVGTRDTMVMAHQTSQQTARKYQAKTVRQAAVLRVQSASASRRAALIPKELFQDIQKLKTEHEVYNENV